MRYLVCIILLWNSWSSSAQDTLSTRFSNSEHIGKNQEFIAKDIYDNTFLQQDNTLLKISKYNSSNYTNSQMDSLTQVDITLALSPLVFYKENQVVFSLSRELAQVSRIDFSEKFPNMQAVYVANSAARRLWIVDANHTGAIRLYNTSSYERHLIYTLESTDNKDYYSTLNYLFWVDKDNTLHGIDTKGNVVLEYTLPSLYEKMQVLDPKRLIYLYEDNLYYVDIVKDKVYPIALEDKSILGFFYNTQKLSIFVGEKLNNYIIKLP